MILQVVGKRCIPSGHLPFPWLEKERIMIVDAFPFRKGWFRANNSLDYSNLIVMNHEHEKWIIESYCMFSWFCLISLHGSEIHKMWVQHLVLRPASKFNRKNKTVLFFSSSCLGNIVFWQRSIVWPKKSAWSEKKPDVGEKKNIVKPMCAIGSINSHEISI